MSNLFAGACDFIAGVAKLEQLPEATLPEIAFAGRSNVGKSSLINALTNRKALARTSHTPGRTQQLNFFDVGGAFIMVDMPGYGYAKVSKGQQQFWQRLIRNYLRGRVTLRCVFILVDARHGLKDSDADFMKMLDECAAPYRIVLTKADDVKKDAQEKVVRDVEEALKKHPAAFPHPYLTSAREKQGIEELQATILQVMT